MTAKKMMQELNKEKINTWFDLGLFIDKLKENKPIPTIECKSSYNTFKDLIGKGGLAFITFYYSIDGVTLEIEKYAKVISGIFPEIPLHYIAGKFYPNANQVIHPDAKKFEIKEIKGFDDWDLYQDFFFTKLERGSKEYNNLIIKYWKQVLKIANKLGKYIEDNNIGLLYLINTNSNPGNVSLALANVLVSEYLGIPVINNNHDFYWEGGNRKVDIKERSLKPGPRDFFFTNSDVGEFFSQIEVLYPWESRSWINLNINNQQTDHLININGHNPANVTEVGTAINIEEYTSITKRQKINAFLQFEQIFSRYQETLIGYSVIDVIKNKLVSSKNPRPILIGNKTKTLNNFLSENIVFLQPTRIVSRKKIEIGFKLIKKLLNFPEFAEKFGETNKLKLTILVTGPIPEGQYEYFEKLIRRFAELINNIPHKFRKNIFLGFLFSELDSEEFKNKFEKPIGIPELYNIASLILLPSETEGRGLPIIEATATGVPIFCRRYHPENVYAEVVGEHLSEKQRLKIIEYDGINITSKHLQDITSRVFFPHKFIDEIKHNRYAVNSRYSINSLKINFENVIKQLYLQLQPNDKSIEVVKNELEKYRKISKFTNKDLEFILNTDNREYMPGYGRLAFMIYLKSLIDPSFFRVEKQQIKGIILKFTKNLVQTNPDKDKIPESKLSEFYNAADNIFNYKNGEFDVRHDHSLSYRHRNKNYYPYHDFTLQELTGLINLLYSKIIDPEIIKNIEQSSHFFTDWNLALSQLTSSTYLAIDDRPFLVKRLKSNAPIAYFPGKFVKYELELFALQSVRGRLKLPIQQELTEKILKKNFKNIAPIYVFAQEKSIGRWPTADDIINYIIKKNDTELKLLYDYQILKVIKTQQLCVGIHFAQLGELALSKLRHVKEKGGFIISNRREAAIMTDIVDIDRFHIGKASYPIAANIMGIPVDSGYVQFIPAGVRATLAYPTPIQTAKDFHLTLKSDLFKQLCEKHGEQKVFDEIRKDAETNGSPIDTVLNNMKNTSKQKADVDYKYVSGVYKDGNPWNGIMANTNKLSGKKWEFEIVSSPNNTKRVTAFIKEFEKQTNCISKIAWNGGYILNPELVGKLGLPESYIGSPLGLLISKGKTISAPLFNKPALIFYNNNKIDIKLVSASKGMVISDNTASIKFTADNYNAVKPKNNSVCYYDLMHNEEDIFGDGRIIVRLAGNVIKEIIKTKKGENVKIIPVGVILSFPANMFPKTWNEIDKELEIKIVGLENIKHAVEAGPMLVDNNKNCINMKKEGWKTAFSISTQAARLDFVDMRGPKIAVGIDKKGNLSVLTINGRIRESVGATHIDMADIMLKFGMQKAMGFDPGGSSTLVVEGKTLNISPYNSEYEKNIFSLPPEPRAVANAVIGYVV